MKAKFQAEETYSKRLQEYTVRDSAWAIGYYVLMVVVYYFMGRVYADTGKYYGYYINICLMIIPLIIVRSFSTLGLCRKNLKRSLIASAMIGLLILLIFTIIPGVLTGSARLPISKIAQNIVYFIVIIGLSEEIIFRGFIQPRLFPLVKKEWVMVLLGGILFVTMHYPFQMASRNMTFIEYLPSFIANAPFQFLLHLAFTALYRRYGNIWGSTVLHGLLDLSMGIFA